MTAVQTASTGQTDPSSVWGSGLLGTIDAWGSTAGKIYGAFTGNDDKKQKPATPATNTQTPASWTKYLPWIGAALVGVLVLGLILRK